MKNKVIFIFLDGVGYGPGASKNPFYKFSLPFIESLSQGKIVQDNDIIKENFISRGIDACLGVKGLPQSATGQTTLFTGINAAQYVGYHFPAFPNEELIDVIKDHSLFKKAKEMGRTATFANAYTPIYFEQVEQGKRQHSVTTLSLLAADLPFRNLDDLKNGNAVYWDMTNKYLVTHYHYAVNIINAKDAGKNLSNLSKDYDLTVYECFLPDIIGHNRDQNMANEFITHLDNFIKGVMENLPPLTTVVITSDHGNMEDMDIAGHTYNPSIFIAIGNEVRVFSKIKSIEEVSSLILKILE